MKFSSTVILKLVFSGECFLTMVTFERGAKVSIILVFRVENYHTIFTCNWFFLAWIFTNVSGGHISVKVMKGFHPSLVPDGGHRERGLRRWIPQLFRFLMFHPNVLLEPLFRSCSIFTLVTLWSLSNSFITTGNPRWRALLCFLAMNSTLRLAFLRSVEGLAFFLINGLVTALLPVSRAKVKSGPTESEKLKA